MAGIYLQEMIENLKPDDMHTGWSGFDLQSFSRAKTLWDYQQEALEHAIKALWKYYGSPGLTPIERKKLFYEWYRDAGMDANLDIPLTDRTTSAKRHIASLLETYYISDVQTLEPEIELPLSKLPYVNLINRMSFWMATGSGKTLIIVKLVELLHILIQRGEIPEHDILILAHRDDLLDQLKLHINEFNTSGDLHIQLHELRDYSDVKHGQPSLFSRSTCHIFYYRSDNLSDEQKEKIIDFRSYDNNGQWYILLDEAHKGDKEDSKRQQIYSILSRNGFLFNFSATFTEERDRFCTAYNFNLSEFIRKGFGKHIYIFNQDTLAFRKALDFTELEKQKTVLKALIILAIIRQYEGKVRSINASLYHRPLLMTLVNSVNTQEADLKIFFRELVRIGKGEIDEESWRTAKQELASELATRPEYLYEKNIKVRIDDAMLTDLTQTDLLHSVFNAPGTGEIEVLIRPSDRKELALKLKTSEEAFALIRIGDVSEWLSQELSGYEINQHFNDESFFERLNHPSSDINMLLGSRSFYEGWDSNRPNVIMYINIGKGFDAKKFILQSVGRGARIEPFQNERKRLRELQTSGCLTEEQESIFHQIKDNILPLESEFIFGTNREALETVINELDQEDTASGAKQISLWLNEEQIESKVLLVPVYREGETLVHQERDQAKFALSPENLDILKKYLAWLKDDRLMLVLHDASPVQIQALKEGLNNSESRFRVDGRPYKNLGVLMTQTLRYLSLHGKSFDHFKILEDEINHFNHMRIFLEEVDLSIFERQLQEFYDKPKKIQEYKSQYAAKQMSLDDLVEKTSELGGDETYTHHGQTIHFKNIQQHYYLPLLVSDDEKLDYIRSVIKVRSEVLFINKLEVYLKQAGNNFENFDWWMFSRLDENSDNINVPYYDPVTNKIYNFKPDFIFWLQKGNDYHIIFVDPKGTGRTEYEHKVDGFRRLFEKDSQPLVFKYNGLNVRVHLFLFTEDKAWVAEYYRKYWLDTIDKMIVN